MVNPREGIRTKKKKNLKEKGRLHAGGGEAGRGRGCTCQCEGPSGGGWRKTSGRSSSSSFFFYSPSHLPPPFPPSFPTFPTPYLPCPAIVPSTNLNLNPDLSTPNFPPPQKGKWKAIFSHYNTTPQTPSLPLFPHTPFLLLRLFLPRPPCASSSSSCCSHRRRIARRRETR